MSPKSRVGIAVELVEAWNLSGLRYAIVHGIDDYPEKIGRDLDILVHVEDSAEMLASAHQIFKRDGWVAVDPPDMWGKRIVAFSADDGLEIHTVTGLSWREIELASTPRPTRRRNMFPLDPWASFAKQILMPGFHGDLKKMSSNALALELTDSDRGLIQQALLALVLPADEVLADSLLTQSVEDLERLIPTVRSSMVKRSWRRNPRSAIGSVTKKVGQRVQGLLQSTGVTVQLIAGDRVDPDELVRWIKAADRSVFTDFVFRMDRSHLSESKLGLLIDAIKGLWLRNAANRPPLSGQRVVFQVVSARSYDTEAGAVRRISRWLDRRGSQPQACVVIGGPDSSVGPSGRIAIKGEDPRVTANAIVQVAIETFIRRHSRLK